jgi:hypothetical protein
MSNPLDVCLSFTLGDLLKLGVDVLENNTAAHKSVTMITS